MNQTVALSDYRHLATVVRFTIGVVVLTLCIKDVGAQIGRFSSVEQLPTVQPQPIEPTQSRDRTESLPLRAETQELSAVVLHAGEAVRFRMPSDWEASEEPAGRQIRLVLTPTEQDLDHLESMWLSLRYRPDRFALLSGQELVQLATERLAVLTRRKAADLTAAVWAVKNNRWARVEFTLSSRRKQTDETTKNGRTEGVYFVQQVAWGRLEIFATREASDEVDNWELLENVIETLELSRPRVVAAKHNASVASAAPILGTWKASRSRMRLGPNGSVKITTDKPFEVEAVVREDSDTGGSELESDKDQERPKLATTVNGKYKATDDLIFTTWVDGSKLNYRWRLHKGDLLLTDNKGRTSKLWRLLE